MDGERFNARIAGENACGAGDCRTERDDEARGRRPKGEKPTLVIDAV